MLLFDTTDLKLFVAAATMESVSRAAEVVHLAPSSASARLSELEKRFGTALLSRRSRGVQPTAAGVLVLQHAKALLQRTEKLDAELMPYRRDTEGRCMIEVASNWNAMATFLPGDLARFLSAHPEASVNVVKYLHNWELLSAVASGTADLGVTGFDGVHPDLAFEPYREDRMMLAVPKAHPLAARPNEAIFLESALAFDFVAVSGNALFETLHEKAREIGKPMKARVYVSSYAEALAMAAAGLGITVVPGGVSFFNSDLVRVPLADAWTLRRLRICRRRDREAPAVVGELIRVLCSAKAAQATHSAEA